jgi:protein-disulfide isomerase
VPFIGARADDLLPPLDEMLAPRTFGSPTAPILVEEFFSLTCTHCARFSNEVMPEITEKLVTPGKVRFLYHDYPLDQVAMTACMVARALPRERYEPFCSALFASQDHWAFAPDGGNSTDALAREALLAGLSRPRFDAAVADDALRQAIAAQQQKDTDTYHIDSTPTFRCNGRQHAGELSFQEFVDYTGAKA